MSRNLILNTPGQGLEYLKNNTEFRIAHLIKLELASSTEDVKVYSYLTDYMHEITWDSNLYVAGKVLSVSNIKEKEGLANYKVSIKVAGEYSEELEKALASSLTSSYVGKSLEILRAYVHTDGTLISMDKDTLGPMRYFEGLLTNLSIDENPTKGSSVVTWECASIFEDFNKIIGRQTNDLLHRGLEIDGSGNLVTVPENARHPDHATDTGFQHANKTFSVATQFEVEEKYSKYNSGFLGIGAGITEKTRTVDKELDLNINLSSNFIPIVYGTRKVQGKPLFVDVEREDPSKVWAVYSICEGPVGFLDISIGGNSTICLNDEDDASSGVICLGNKKNGDTLGRYWNLHTSMAEVVGDANVSRLSAHLDWDEPYTESGVIETPFNELYNKVQNNTATPEEEQEYLDRKSTDYQGLRINYYFPGSEGENLNEGLIRQQNGYNKKVQIGYNDGWVFASDSSTGTSHPVSGKKSVWVVGDDYTATLVTGDRERDFGLGGTYFVRGAPNPANQDMIDVAAGGGFLRQEPGDLTYWDENSLLADTAYVILQFRLTDTAQELPELWATVEQHDVITDPDDSNPDEKIRVPWPWYPSNPTDSNDMEEYGYNPNNPVWHLLDYLTNSTYGSGIEYSRIDLPSFYQAAAECEEIDTSYDIDFIDYWRYSGFSEYQHYPEGPRDNNRNYKHKSNAIIPTDKPVSANLKSMLEQIDGSLNLVGGKFHISLEGNTAPIATITEHDIIGTVKLKDLSQKSKWNSIEASISDPSLDWGKNSVSFFNSEYLEQDNGIKKKGRVNLTFNTNYYSARSRCKFLLDKSRFSREVTVTTTHKFIHLQINNNVVFDYPRFFPETTNFRIKGVEILSNGLVNLTLKEYDPSIYTGITQKQEIYRPVHDILPRPLNLGYVPRPQDTPWNVSVPEGSQGILVWDPIDREDILRYEVESWLDPDVTISVSPSAITNGKVYLQLYGMTLGQEYLLRVRAIYNKGQRSTFTTMYVEVFPEDAVPNNITRPLGFYSENTDSLGVFTGPDVILHWDISTEFDSPTYHLQFKNDQGVVIRDHFTSGSTYTYDFTSNRADYLANEGVDGAYRGLNIGLRITNGNPGDKFSNWTYL